MLRTPWFSPIKRAHLSGNQELALEIAKKLLTSLQLFIVRTTPISLSACPGVLRQPLKHLIKLLMPCWTSFVLCGPTMPPSSYMSSRQILGTIRRHDPCDLVSGENSTLTRPSLKSMLIKSDFGLVIGPFSDFSLVTTSLGKESSTPNYKRLWTPMTARLLWTCFKPLQLSPAAFSWDPT